MLRDLTKTSSSYLAQAALKLYEGGQYCCFWISTARENVSPSLRLKTCRLSSSHHKLTWHANRCPLLIYTFTSIPYSLFLPCSLSVCTRFPPPPPSCPSPSLTGDLKFFPLGSHCVLTGTFVTQYPLSVSEHHVTPLCFLFFCTLTQSLPVVLAAFHQPVCHL